MKGAESEFNIILQVIHRYDLQEESQGRTALASLCYDRRGDNDDYDAKCSWCSWEVRRLVG